MWRKLSTLEAYSWRWLIKRFVGVRMIIHTLSPHIATESASSTLPFGIDRVHCSSFVRRRHYVDNYDYKLIRCWIFHTHKKTLKWRTSLMRTRNLLKLKRRKILFSNQKLRRSRHVHDTNTSTNSDTHYRKYRLLIFS